MFQNTIKIAFASMTNVAVDRILLSLQELGFNDFVRVGSLKKIAKPILPFTCQIKNGDTKELHEMIQGSNITTKPYIDEAIRLFQSNKNNSLLQDAFLIGITCIATNFEILEGIVCPIVILDECSQMTEPMSLLPICRFQCSFALLVGDPKQLPPTLPCTLASDVGAGKAGLERTMFERLDDAGIPKMMLSTQYRCHPSISNISNVLFYDSKLRNGIDGMQRSSLIPGLGPLAFISLEGPETKIGSSYRNEYELRLIVKMVSAMLSLGIESDQIGVISLYKSQASYLESEFSGKGINVQAATVDSFQGSEKDIIIVSTTRSTKSIFLEDPRRINVALTRAKKHMFIVACETMTESSLLWRKIKQLCLSSQPGVVSSQEMISLFPRQN
jgi:superfamily I DNA and/or RNA helicase